MSDEKKSLKQIMAFRKEKLSKIKDNGINPYPVNFSPKDPTKIILSDYKSWEGKDVTIAGRIMALRKMGKVSFSQIMDSGGRIQIFISRDSLGESMYNTFKLLDIGDFIETVQQNNAPFVLNECSIFLDSLDPKGVIARLQYVTYIGEES